MDIFNEDVWPPFFDDRDIDDIIWEEIEDSESRGDFICYLLHRPQKAQHREEAQAKLEVLETLDRTPVGYTRAVQRIRALAEKGDPKAMFHMGKMHVIGIGVPQDTVSGIAWYEKAIELGEMRACCNLGWIYLYGFEKIPPNKEEAFRLLSMGAENGVYIAKASLGQMYLAGDSVPVNIELGLKLLTESFDEGYTNAGNHLADAYFSGRFFPQDLDAGHEWLNKLAERGEAQALGVLGFYLVAGSYGQTDVPRGISLLEQAIEKEHMPAYVWLGNFYRRGQGVEQDLEKARQWFEKGSAAGNTDCDKILAEMMDEATPPGAAGSSSVH